MLNFDPEEVAAFVSEVEERLPWMDEELVRLHNESDRRALAAAREELMRMISNVVLKTGLPA